MLEDIPKIEEAKQEDIPPPAESPNKVLAKDLAKLEEEIVKNDS